jgi:uncharacterized protein (DUF1501 family)
MASKRKPLIQGQAFSVYVDAADHGHTARAIGTDGTELATATYSTSIGAAIQCAVLAFDRLGDKEGKDQMLSELAELINEVTPGWL